MPLRAALLMAMAALPGGAFRPAHRDTTVGSLAQAAASEAAERALCPDLEEAAPNSDLKSFDIPYRLGRTKYGLGIFALRKVHKGEIVWRDSLDWYVDMPRVGWQSTLNQLVRDHNWKGSPDMDEAYSQLMPEADGGSEVPTEMLAKFVQFDWHVMVNGSLMMQLDDARYFNYAPEEEAQEEDADLLQVAPSVASRQGAQSMDTSLLQVAQEKDASLLQVATSAASRQGARSKLAITGKGLKAIRDIEPCEELLEDYWASGDEVAEPEWFNDWKEEFGGSSNFETDPTSTRVANVGKI